MIITNIKGTEDKNCKCGSWLDHWKNFSGNPLPKFCPEKNCIGKDLVGAHVLKFGSTDKKTYIVPLCSRHNLSTGSISIYDSVALVSANVSETCGKNIGVVRYKT